MPSTKGPHPVAIVVHGGCWVAKLGNMDERAVALDNMRPLAAALTEAGIATWNVEYRRLGQCRRRLAGHVSGRRHVRLISSGRWRKQQRTGSHRVIAIGHSAGGHLVMWLAARAKLPKTSELYTSNPLTLSGVVDLDGPPDLKATIAVQQPICGTPVITDLMGGSPDQQPERYVPHRPLSCCRSACVRNSLLVECLRRKPRRTKRRPRRPAMPCRRPCSPMPGTSCSSIRNPKSGRR